MKKLFLFLLLFVGCKSKIQYHNREPFWDSGRVDGSLLYKKINDSVRFVWNGEKFYLDTFRMIGRGISIATADTAYATWLGPDSVMFVSGHGIFTDTTIIANSKHQYKK